MKPPETPNERYNWHISYNIRRIEEKMEAHIKELLNRLAPEQTTDMIPAEEDKPINLEAQSTERQQCLMTSLPRQ